MRAVNLIPEGERRGAGGAAGRSGGAAYVLLGAMALVVVMAAVYALAGKSLNDKKAELAAVTRQADAAQARATQLAAYTRFQSLRAKRVQTVSQLAASRFDWAHALHEVSRVMPSNAWLTQLTGTVAPGVNVGGGSGASVLRGAIPAPAIEITGCTTSQSSVAKVLARLRLIDGVQRVSLADSQKADVGGGSSGGGGGASGDCRAGNSRFPLFTAVVFFNAPATPAVGAATGSTATAAATTATAGTQQPAAATTPSTTTAPSSTTTTTPSSTTQPASGGKTP